MKTNVIISGLIIGVVVGLVGNFLPEGAPLKVAWAVSGLGLIVAYLLLAARYARTSRDEVAVGFALMAIGEAVLFSGLAYGVQGSQTAFAGGASIFFVALLLINLPDTLAIWTRAAGVIAGLLFAVAALQIYAGQPVLANSSPLVGSAYGLLSVAIIGWIIAVLRGERTAVSGEHVPQARA